MSDIPIGVLRGRQTKLATTGEQPVLYIFDKIVNLRLNRADGSGIVIRSDYEAVSVAHGNHKGEVHFVRMQEKPQIKVKYNQVTDGTAIKIVVEVTNLYVYLAGAQSANDLSQRVNPFVSITIEMGYFANFDNFALAQYRRSETGAGSKKLLDELAYDYNMKQEGRRYIRSINANILSMYQASPPPDAVTVINCVVGDITASYLAVPNAKDARQRVKEGGNIEELFFKTMTKRYVRSTVSNAFIETSDIESNGGKHRVSDSASGVTSTYDLPGSLTDSAANKYGVRVLVSANLKSAYVFKHGLHIMPVASTAEQTMNCIQREIAPSMRFMQTTDGNYIAYHKDLDKDIDKLSSEFAGDTAPEIIPAVYNVSLGALRMVSCPFFNFVNPFSLIQFNARYSTSNTVGTFYKPAPGTDQFMAIKCQITFSTCDDDNEMLLTSTDEGEAGK